MRRTLVGPSSAARPAPAAAPRPVVQKGGLAVSWRNGEPGHGGAASAVNASSFALVYEWDGPEGHVV